MTQRTVKFRAYVYYPCVVLESRGNGKGADWKGMDFMADVQTIYFSTGKIRVKKIGEKYDMTNGGSCDIQPENIKALMQFTGLTDKNGKEIWEGDLLRVKPKWEESEDWVHLIVKDEEDSFVVEVGKPLSWGQLPPERWSEVIGNIHENPNLIN